MINRYTALCLLIPVMIFSGCSKKTEEMRTVRPKLVLDIFKLIKQEKHDEAVVQIKKLKELEPTNTHLPVLEEVEKNNSDLKKINELLREKEKQTEATDQLKKIAEERGINEKELLQTAEKLRDVVRMEKLTDIIVAPVPSFDPKTGFRPASRVLKDSIEEFLRLAQKQNVPVRLRNKVIRRLANVSRLRREEKVRAVQSLELLAPGLRETSYQTMMALSLYAEQQGTKR